MAAQKMDVGDSSPLLKRVLIPFYVVRIAIYLINIASLILIIIFVSANKDDFIELYQRYGRSSGFVILMMCIVMLVIILLCLILDIVCIVKRARRTLSHRFFLIVNVCQTVVWTVFFALSFIGPKTTTGIIISSVIYASFIGLLIYASIAFHKHRKTPRYSNVVYEDQPRVFGQYTPYGEGQDAQGQTYGQVQSYGQPTWEQGQSHGEGYGQETTEMQVPKPHAAASSRLLGDERQ